MTDKQKLKPCPFCGGEARSGVHDPSWDIREGIAWCYAECGASVTRKTKAEAITAWNTRAPDSAPEGEGLVGELDLAAIDDAWRLIQMATLNARLLGIENRGDDLRLKHELRMMALAFSRKHEPERGFAKGSGQSRDVMARLKELHKHLTALRASDRDAVIKAKRDEWEKERRDYASYNGPTMQAEKDLAFKVKIADELLALKGAKP
jgi:Lar family restriction alleviation protein